MYLHRVSGYIENKVKPNDSSTELYSLYTGLAVTTKTQTRRKRYAQTHILKHKRRHIRTLCVSFAFWFWEQTRPTEKMNF